MSATRRARAALNYEAPPTGVAGYLPAGTHTLAVTLTNGPSGYYLDIRATCVQ